MLRSLIHIPVGLLGGFMLTYYIPIGLMFCLTFLFYEAIQDWRKRDNSYKDVIGFMYGLAAVGILIFFL